MDKAADPEENQTYHRCVQPSGHMSFKQKGPNIAAFLKRNAFVILTMTAVVLGKCFS